MPDLTLRAPERSLSEIKRSSVGVLALWDFWGCSAFLFSIHVPCWYLFPLNLSEKQRLCRIVNFCKVFLFWSAVSAEHFWVERAVKCYEILYLLMQSELARSLGKKGFSSSLHWPTTVLSTLIRFSRTSHLCIYIVKYSNTESSRGNRLE